jgi:hypothetical protein
VLGVIEVLDPLLGEGNSGRDLQILGIIASQTASIVRLSTLYDGLGARLLAAFTANVTPEGVREAIGSSGLTHGDDGLAELAVAFHDLARSGPEASRFAASLLTQVAGYVRPGR